MADSLRRVLAMIRDGRLRQLAPELNALGNYDYCRALERVGLTPCEEAVELIEGLVRLGVLRKEVHDRVVSCAKCGSTGFLVRARCPYCGSPSFRGSAAIEHLTCGYVGFEHEFASSKGKLLCPKCGRELRDLGVDYLRIAEVKKCEKCGEAFSAPILTYLCLSCGYENKAMELEFKEIYRYVAEPVSESREMLVLELLSAIKSLAPEDYMVLGPHAKVTVQPGVEIEFDIAVWKRGESFPIVAVELVDSINRDTVMMVYAKARLANAKKVIVVHRGDAGEELQRLSSSLGIALLRYGSTGKLIDEVLKKLQGAS